MKYRKLRIAWSVAWGVLAVAIVVLCVRSYWQCDSTNFIIGPANDLLAVQSYQGRVIFIQESSGKPWQRTVRSLGINWLPDQTFFYKRAPGFTSVIFPDWFAILSFAGIGAVPWIPWRFSLRTLLIGMSAAAIGLGWIVYAFRK